MTRSVEIRLKLAAFQDLLGRISVLPGVESIGVSASPFDDEESETGDLDVLVYCRSISSATARAKCLSDLQRLEKTVPGVLTG